MQRRQAIAAVSLAAGFALVAGCDEETSAPVPNQPPITQINGGPEDSSRAPARSTFFLLGSDYDGTVNSTFDWILDTYPKSVATIEQIVPSPPSPTDPRWQRHRSNTLVVLAAADTLRADPRGDIGLGEFDRWHTVYVRAVDNEGAVDESPESRTYFAYTQAPVIRLQSPVQAGEPATVPRTFIANWDGLDPIGTGEPYQDPLESRWVFLPVTLDGAGDPIGFPETLYALPDSAWSAWRGWSRDDSSGVEKSFVNQVAPGTLPRAYVFAVQGRDEAGAITPKFDAATAGRNNYGVFQVDGRLPIGPTLVVHTFEDTLTTWTFAGTQAPPVAITTTEDTLRMWWDPPSTGSYGARSNGTRYGWNLQDPGNDEEWTAWGTNRFAVAHPVTVGTHVFRLQARDQLGQITNAVITVQRLTKPSAGARSSPARARARARR